MAIFRRRRRAGATQGAAAPEPAGAARADLSTRLRAIAADVAAPEEALDPALRAILEMSRAGAGAINLFDSRHSLLRLAAEVGLSDEGCRRLRNVRRGDPAGWDIPLHGLLNRRAYLIESASKNRYVPALVQPASAMRSVACVPFYDGPTPIGTLILVALAPRFFEERDIRSLERPLRELARMIEAARRRAGADVFSAPPAATPGTPAFDAEQGRLQAALDATAAAESRLGADLERPRRAAERAEDLAASLAQADSERSRLAAALEAAAAERADQARAYSTLERACVEAERRAEAARVELDQVRHAAAESEAGARARAAEGALRIERLQGHVADTERAVVRERELKREHERITDELLAAAAREQHLREALEASFEHRGTGEPGDLRRAVETAEAAEESRAAAVAEAEAAHAALTSTQAVVEALEDEATQARAEIERLEKAEPTLRGEQRRLAAALEEAETEAREAGALLATLQHEVAALRDVQGNAAVTGREHEAERATLAAHIETLAAERDQLRDRVAELEAERDRLAAASAPRVRPAPAEATPASAASRPREGIRVVTVAADKRGRVREIDPGRRTVAVLDHGGSWGSAVVNGHQVEVLNPTEDVTERLAEMEAARIVVNLAAPGALQTLAMVRAAGSTARFWGCVATPGSARALALGMIEPALRPIDPDAILAALGDHARAGTRVVTAGPDVDALMSVRQSMARERMSVSMAWDAKQAMDLLGVVRPEIVLIDLELPRRAGYAIVAGLTAVDPIPHAVLIPGGPEAPDAFAALLADPIHAARATPRERMLADILRRSQAPAAERRAKLQVFGSK